MAIKTDINHQFYTKIHRQARKERFPLRAMFEVTYQCNFNCLHCYVPAGFKEKSEIKDLQTKEIFSILDQLKEMGCFYLGFTGGEPFAREDFLDILHCAKTKGFEIIIYTNGSLINERIADELKKLKPNKVDITINSLKNVPFEEISQMSGSYERVFRAIELLHERNIPLGFKSCLLKANEDNMGGIKKFAKSHKALHRLDTMLMPKLDGSKEPYKYRGRFGTVLKTVNRAPQTAHRKSPLDGVYPERSRGARDRQTASLFKCGVGLDNLVINPFGELKMCIQIGYPKYNVLESSLKECWHRLKKLVDNITVDENYKCGECGLQSFCKWCPGRAWLENGSFTSCVPESKERAEYSCK